MAVLVNIAKADLATRDGCTPDMLAFGRKPRLLPSSIEEITDGDILKSISRAVSGDQQLHLLYTIQGAARQAAQEVEAKFDVLIALNRRCGKGLEIMDFEAGDSV